MKRALAIDAEGVDAVTVPVAGDRLISWQAEGDTPKLLPRQRPRSPLRLIPPLEALK